MEHAISERYARALWKLLDKDASLEEVWRPTFEKISELWAIPEALAVIQSPALPLEPKKRLLACATEGQGADTRIAAFVNHMLEAKRGPFIFAVCQKFEELWLQFHKRLPGILTTASPCGQTERLDLEAKLTKLFKEAVYFREIRVEPQILGGFVFETKTLRLDMSLRRQLHTMLSLQAS